MDDARDVGSLSIPQFRKIVNYIWEHHRFGGRSIRPMEPCRHIKYIDPIFDMRTGSIFCIKFRGLMNDGKKEFVHTPGRSMYKEVMDWLNGGEEE